MLRNFMVNLACVTVIVAMICSPLVPVAVGAFVAQFYGPPSAILSAIATCIIGGAFIKTLFDVEWP